MFEPESRMFDVGYDDYMEFCIFPYLIIREG
jgi:hypothetical protein